MGWQQDGTLLGIALAVGLLARVLAGVQFDGAHLAGDETYYVYEAESIASGLGHESAWRPPLYPAFMAAAVTVWADLDAVRIAQVALSLLAVALVFRVVLARFGRRAAFISALACALSPSLVHYCHFLWSESLNAPLMAIFIYAIDRWDRGGRKRDLVAAGVTLGLMALTREVWVYFGAVVLGWILWGARFRLRAAAPALAIFAFSAAAVVLPWTVRNYAASGSFVLISMNRWFPIAMGNLYPADDWFFGSATNAEREALKEAVVGLSGQDLDAKWREVALGLIAEHQPWWVFQKAARGPAGLFNARSQQLRFLEEGWVRPSRAGAALLIATDVVGTYGLMILGILGLWVVPGGRLKVLLVAAVFYLIGLHTIANATPRFAVPLLPIFALYVGPLFARSTPLRGSTGAVPGTLTRRWQRIGAGVTVAVFVLIPLPKSSRTLKGLVSSLGSHRPDIIWISLDTLRRDAVGAYTAPGRSFTPNLDALAAESVRFDRAYASVPFTLSSHMTSFTGVYPDVHGVATREDRLAEGVATLPVLLRQAGYTNFAFVTNAWMKREYGFGRGFDHYEELPPGETFADRVSQRALARLDEHSARDDEEAPVFLFLHLLDAHSDWKGLPYDAPAPYRRDVAAADRDFCNAVGACATRFLIAVDKSAAEVPNEVSELVHALYLRGVSYLDAQLGDFFAALETRGIFDDALVIVTSDHGEEFHEHGRFLHSQPYEENLAVPLLVKFPNGEFAGRVVKGLVADVDLLPTLVDYLGLRAPSPLQGRSFLPLMTGDALETGNDVVFGQDKPDGMRYVLRDERFKLLLHVAGEGAVLFDLQADPAETVDGSAEHPERTRRLTGRLEAMLRANSALGERYPRARRGASPLDPDEEAWLRSLGYLD